MTAKTDKNVIGYIESNKSVEDIVVLLTMTDVYPTKAEARTYVTELLSAKGLAAKKTITKVSQLKEWFLNQDNPTMVTKEEIKQQCETIGMKGGSIQYYINSYTLAIELAKDLTK